MKPDTKKRLSRLPLLVLGMGSLLTAIWGGLIRLPINLPLLVEHANWITFHGPLMVCGFLGTLIGLERAVGLPSRWTYGAPLLTGLGAVLIIGGVLGSVPVLLMVSGSLLFAIVTVRVVTMQPVLFTVVMSLGAWCWVAGNGFWLAGWTFDRVVPWWIAFLGLTIVGERLDLSRFQKPSVWSRPLFGVALGLFLTGVVLTALLPHGGQRLTGLGMLALAGWLGRFDIARRTVRQPGLPRYMAVCLLIGYVWLAAAGALLLLVFPLESASTYDAALHAFFVGFVFSMIFGHAPVIFPAVLQLPVAFRTAFYGHLILLQAGLLLRLAGDLSGWTFGRQAGSVLNGLAILLFLANTVRSLLKRPR